jgi:hypothetical protein
MESIESRHALHVDPIGERFIFGGFQSRRSNDSRGNAIGDLILVQASTMPAKCCRMDIKFSFCLMAIVEI